MFENYDDILTVDDIAEALKIGSTQAYKICLLYTSDAADE